MYSRLQRAIDKIRAQSPADVRLAALATPVLFTAAVSIRAIGLRRTSVVLARLLARPTRGQRVQEPVRVVAAVDLIAGRLPATACMERSVTSWILLHRHGHAASLMVGAPAGGLGAEFRAHAWVEVDGSPVGESPELLDKFVRLGDPLATKP